VLPVRQHFFLLAARYSAGKDLITIERLVTSNLKPEKKNQTDSDEITYDRS